MKLAILTFLFGITIAKPRLSLYLIILFSPLVIVYQSAGWDPRIWIACVLAMRALLTASGEVFNNIKVIAAGALFFAISEVVLQVRSSVVPSEDASSAQQALVYFLAGALFAFAASQLVQNTIHLSRTLLCVGIAVSYTTGYALWERFFASTGSQLVRIGSTLINPNSLGAYGSLCAITLLMARRLVNKRSWRVFIAVGVLMSATAVFLSLSRASALALAPALVLPWAIQGNKLNAKRAFAAIAISVLMMAFLATAIRAVRVQGGGADAASQQKTDISQALDDFTRYEAATYSLKQWSEHPLFGVGFMLFPGINYQDTGFNLSTHDTVLELLVGTGLVGVVLLAYIIAQLWKRLSRAGRFAFLPVVLGFFINSLFGDFAQAFELTTLLSMAYLVAKRIQEPMAIHRIQNTSAAVTF